MDQYEIKESFDLHLQISQLVLKSELWEIKPRRLKFTNAKESRADQQGDIYISLTKWENSTDYVALNRELREFFADLHTGFIKREKFLWQRIARKLGLLDEIVADDLVECELCGTPSQLTRTKRCVDCRRIEEAVLSAPHIAEKILCQLKKD